MQRINTSTKAADLHGPGKDGFRPGDPNAGVLPTQLSDEWCNNVQESLCRVVEESGRTLGAAGHDDLFLAIGAIVANAVQAAANPTGKLSMFARTTAPTGWLILRGNTIGDANSGANERAHADTQALFVHLWDTFPDRPLFESNGAAASRGASALADFNAHKRLQLWDSRDQFWGSSGTGRAVGSWQDSGFTLPLDGGYPTNGAPFGAEGFLASPYNGADGHAVVYKVEGSRTFVGNDVHPESLAWLPCIKL